MRIDRRAVRQQMLPFLPSLCEKHATFSILLKFLFLFFTASVKGNFFRRNIHFIDVARPPPDLLHTGKERPMSSVIEDLATHVKNRRKQAGLSQEELARQTGISLTLIRDIERRAANPTLSSLERLAGAFEISLVELLDFQNTLHDPAKISASLVRELKRLPAPKLRLMLEFIRVATR